jgi:hypothetical protein
LEELNNYLDNNGCIEGAETDPIWDRLEEADMIHAGDIKSYYVRNKIYELKNELYALPF